MSIFGWSDEVQRRVTELRDAWAKVKASPAFTPQFQHAYRDDIAFVSGFLDKIARDEGALDVGELTGAEISARRVMWALFDTTKDPAFSAEKRPQGGDIDAALPIASTIDREAKAATKAAGAAAAAIPTEYKIAGALALVLVLVVALKV